MATGFVKWYPEAVQGILSEVDRRMIMAGQIGVGVSRSLVPVDTGQTKASIGFTYDKSRKLLQIHADTRWAVFVEMGTRRMPARPFLRPGIAAAGKAFGGDLSGEVQLLNTPDKYRSGYQTYHSGAVYQHRARGIRGFFGRKHHTVYSVNYGR